MTADTFDMDAHIARMQEEQALAHKLVEDNPSLPYITAYVMAGDIKQGERVKAGLKDGTHPVNESALIHVGSYARIDLLFWMQAEGLIDYVTFLDWFAVWWSGSDPDDTDPRMLATWQDIAKTTLGYWYDGDTLPPRTRVITVYRGQRMTDPTGCAWTTDIAIAKKFAMTGGGRTTIKDGVLLKGKVKVADVLAFITGRNESEVIVDPANVR